MRGDSPLFLLLLGVFLLPLEGSRGDDIVDGAAAAVASRRVHAFFYLWYGNPETDGEWRHWNHEVLPHWDEALRRKFPATVRFVPPGDAHSPFYPRRGCYSSSCASTMKEQFGELARAGVGVVVLSWSGRPEVPGTHDTQGIKTDALIEGAMDVAAAAGLEVALHLEPYENRSVTSVRDDVTYLTSRFGSHAAMHRRARRVGPEAGLQDAPKLPVLYVYDSYRITDWERMLTPDRPLSIRGTPHDAFLLALWLQQHSGEELLQAGFDGAYTYFAADGFTFGSTVANWPRMASFCRRNNLLFTPSVGPGYDDSKIRPWNRGNTRPRDNGAYYNRMWQAAVGCGTTSVSITSYNEWGEGTQIEPAIPRRVPDASKTKERVETAMRGTLQLPEEYQSYYPLDPFFYLNRTLHWAAFLADREEEEPEMSDGSVRSEL
ncbi:hypothetical protein T484DRAFT_1907859 [Baffinella frigidus]|nr:hypothetical protein T484DRAFT_1907859 [Cryptophyta sp. CCMP2293]